MVANATKSRSLFDGNIVSSEFWFQMVKNRTVSLDFRAYTKKTSSRSGWPIGNEEFSSISDEDLDGIVREILSLSPNLRLSCIPSPS